MHIAVLLKVLKVDDNDASPFSTATRSFLTAFYKSLRVSGRFLGRILRMMGMDVLRRAQWLFWGERGD